MLNIRASALMVVAASSIAAICFVAFFSRFTDFVLISGNNLFAYPGTDLMWDYALGIGWAVALAAGLFLCPGLGEDRGALLLSWAAKCAAALVVGLVFEYQYGLDGDGYFTNAIMPGFTWEGLHAGTGTGNIAHLTWLHLRIVPGSYHAAKVGFSMISLIALYQFYKAFKLVLPRLDSRFLVGLALYPSILIWSSMLGKDAPMLLGMALYTRGCVLWSFDRRAHGFLLVLAGCLIALYIRSWYLPILVGPFIAMAALGGLRGRRAAWRLPAIVMGIIMLVVTYPYLRQYWNIEGAGGLLEQRSLMIGGFSGGGSTLTSHEINGAGGLVRYGPSVAFTALFRPLPFEVPNLFGLIQGLENLFLLLLCFRAAARTRFQEFFEPLILWATLLIVSWALLYGFVAYNLGSLARYKLQVLPVFLALLMYLGRKRRTEASPEKLPCAA